MNKFKKIINTHNMEVIRKYYDQLNNCETKINCSMNGLCNLKHVVYFPKGKCKRLTNLYWNFVN